MATVFSNKQLSATVQAQGDTLVVQGQATYGGDSKDVTMNNGRIFKIGSMDQQIGDCYVSSNGNTQVSFYSVENLSLMSEASTILKQIYDDLIKEAAK